MTTKLNSFTIPDSLKKVMRDKIQESRAKDIEIGFNLCTENADNLLHDETHCTGVQCSVDIPKGCIRGKHVGLFHTHHSGSSKPSIQDIANAYQIGINCIGSTEEEDVKCYIRKNEYTREGFETIVTAMIRYEEPLHLSQYSEEDIKNYRRWIANRNILLDRYLRQQNIDIK